MPLKDWFSVPQLTGTSDGPNEVDRVTWLELFFDLIFVVAVAELAHSFGKEVSWEGTVAFLLLFVPVWWIWISHVFYTDRFATNDVSFRLMTFVIIVGIGGMAFHVHDALGETSVGFALSYALARLTINVMWWWGGRHNEEARPMTDRFNIGFTISVVLWVASVFVPAPLRFVMWGVAMFIELVTPLFTIEIQSKLPAFTRSHIPERFGVFTVLVLREPIAGVIEGMREGSEQLTPSLALDGVLGLLLAFLLWWVYFDQVSEFKLKENSVSTFIYNYLHLPLTLGITAIGAGMLNAYDTGGEPLADPVRGLICGGVALALLSMALLELLFNVPDEKQKAFNWLDGAQFVAGLAVIALGLLGETLRPVQFFALLLLIVSLPVVLELLLVTPGDMVIEEADGE